MRLATCCGPAATRSDPAQHQEHDVGPRRPMMLYAPPGTGAARHDHLMVPLRPDAGILTGPARTARAGPDV